jgi:hypothetical protein
MKATIALTILAVFFVAGCKKEKGWLIKINEKSICSFYFCCINV